MNQSQESLPPEGSSLRHYREPFSSSDADIILCSVDSINFRVSSDILRNTSGFFRSTLSLPQPKMKKEAGGEEVLYLGEDHEVIEKLLRIIYGFGIPISDLTTYDEVKDVLQAADKYEMPGVIAVVRLAITSPRFLESPVQLYALSCRYGWTDEAKLASRLSLDIDLSDEKITSILENLDSRDLMKLLRLRWKRRELLKKGLDDATIFAANLDIAYKCSRCNLPVDMVSWREFKWMLLDEFDKHPSGETLLTHSFLSSPQANALFELHCPASSCRRICFNKAGTIANFRNIIEALPMTI